MAATLLGAAAGLLLQSAAERRATRTARDVTLPALEARRAAAAAEADALEAALAARQEGKGRLGSTTDPEHKGKDSGVS